MFDPERDDDEGSRPFLVRLLAVAIVTAAACAALLPSVTQFSAGGDAKTCLAIVDGWHADRPGLNAAEQAAEATGFAGTRPSAAEERALERADAYLAWREGPGACIPQSRHRLILSGIGLGAIAAVVAVLLVVRRTRKDLRPAPVGA